MPLTRVCFVPVCPNTSENTTKLFLRVPTNLEIRKLWWKIAKVPGVVYTATGFFCCEDHLTYVYIVINFLLVGLILYFICLFRLKKIQRTGCTSKLTSLF